MPYKHIEGARLTGPNRNGAYTLRWTDTVLGSEFSQSIRLLLPQDDLKVIEDARGSRKIEVLFGTGPDTGRIRIQPVVKGRRKSPPSNR